LQLFYGNYVIANVTAVFVEMVFSDEYNILIKNLYQLKGYKEMEKFSNKCWTKIALTGC